MSNKRTAERGQIDGQALLWILAFVAVFYASWYTWQGMKWTGHQVKCGVIRVFTSERCAPRAPIGPPPDPLEGVEMLDNRHRPR